MADAFTVLLVVALLSPLGAMGLAAHYYKIHRMAPEPKRQVPIAAFIGTLLALAFITYWLGLSIGLNVACSSSSSSNLCGLLGAFVIGPLFSSLSVAVVAKLWSSYARKAL